MPINENFDGSDATGTDGDTSRVITLGNSAITVSDGFHVFVDGFFLYPTTDYTVSHNSSSSTVTFVNSLFDSQRITVIYEISGPGQGTSGAAGVLPFDTQLWYNEIEYSGESVTVRTVTDSSFSKWGDATESTSDTSSVKCMVDEFTPEEIKQMEGIFPQAEKRFFFKGDQGNILEGNRVVHDSETYEIVRVLKRQASGVTFLQEAWGQKT